MKFLFVLFFICSTFQIHSTETRRNNPYNSDGFDILLKTPAPPQNWFEYYRATFNPEHTTNLQTIAPFNPQMMAHYMGVVAPHVQDLVSSNCSFESFHWLMVCMVEQAYESRTAQNQERLLKFHADNLKHLFQKPYCTTLNTAEDIQNLPTLYNITARLLRNDIWKYSNAPIEGVIRGIKGMSPEHRFAATQNIILIFSNQNSRQSLIGLDDIVAKIELLNLFSSIAPENYQAFQRHMVGHLHQNGRSLPEALHAYRSEQEAAHQRQQTEFDCARRDLFESETFLRSQRIKEEQTAFDELNQRIAETKAKIIIREATEAARLEQEKAARIEAEAKALEDAKLEARRKKEAAKKQRQEAKRLAEETTRLEQEQAARLATEAVAAAKKNEDERKEKAEAYRAKKAEEAKWKALWDQFFAAETRARAELENSLSAGKKILKQEYEARQILRRAEEEKRRAAELERELALVALLQPMRDEETTKRRVISAEQAETWCELREQYNTEYASVLERFKAQIEAEIARQKAIQAREEALDRRIVDSSSYANFSAWRIFFDGPRDEALLTRLNARQKKITGNRMTKAQILETYAYVCTGLINGDLTDENFKNIYHALEKSKNISAGPWVRNLYDILRMTILVKNNNFSCMSNRDIQDLSEHLIGTIGCGPESDEVWMQQILAPLTLDRLSHISERVKKTDLWPCIIGKQLLLTLQRMNNVIKPKDGLFDAYKDLIKAMNENYSGPLLIPQSLYTQIQAHIELNIQPSFPDIATQILAAPWCQKHTEEAATASALPVIQLSDITQYAVDMINASQQIQADVQTGKITPEAAEEARQKAEERISQRYGVVKGVQIERFK